MKKKKHFAAEKYFPWGEKYSRRLY